MDCPTGHRLFLRGVFPSPSWRCFFIASCGRTRCADGAWNALRRGGGLGGLVDAGQVGTAPRRFVDNSEGRTYSDILHLSCMIYSIRSKHSNIAAVFRLCFLPLQALTSCTLNSLYVCCCPSLCLWGPTSLPLSLSYNANSSVSTLYTRLHFLSLSGYLLPPSLSCSVVAMAIIHGV